MVKGCSLSDSGGSAGDGFAALAMTDRVSGGRVDNSCMIKLFVGLGNPGAEYEHTRHNAGFWFIDQLAQQLKAPLQPEKNFHGWASRATFEGQTLWLLKPATFMNLSGRSVAALAKFYKISTENMLVAHDELDLTPGEAKLKLGGGHAGHNGLRDIHAQMGTDAYWRLRLRRKRQ